MHIQISSIIVADMQSGEEHQQKYVVVKNMQNLNCVGTVVIEFPFFNQILKSIVTFM